jgi:phage terminase large subunit
LIEYERLNANEPDYKKVALGIRIIDVNTGDIIDVGKISNFKNSSENLNTEIDGIEEGVQ